MIKHCVIISLFLLSICACNESKKPSYKNPIVFGRAFFSALAKKENIDHFFITQDEIRNYYKELDGLVLQDSTIKSKQTDDLHIRQESFNKWKENYIQFRESTQFEDSVLDSINFDYVIARAGEDVTIPWPRSQKHTPDLYGAHYAKISIFYHSNDQHYLLVFLPFFTGDKWVFDATAVHEIIVNRRNL